MQTFEIEVGSISQGVAGMNVNGLIRVVQVKAKKNINRRRPIAYAARSSIFLRFRSNIPSTTIETLTIPYPA